MGGKKLKTYRTKACYYSELEPGDIVVFKVAQIKRFNRWWDWRERKYRFVEHIPSKGYFFTSPSASSNNFIIRGYSEDKYEFKGLLK